MTNSAKKTQLLTPAKTRHAVQSVVFVCELSSQIGNDEFQQLIRHYEATPPLSEFLPRKTEHRTGISVSLGGVGNISVNQHNDLAGVTFDRVSANGSIEWALAAQPGALMITCNEYTRWQPIFAQALALFGECFSILSSSSISILGLQYVDEFFWNGSIDELDAKLVFLENGELLPAKLFNHRGIWHSHSGWFEDENSPSHHRLLTNLNVNLVQQSQPERVVIQIITALRSFLPKVIIGNSVTETEKYFEQSHIVNKQRLNSLLSKFAADLIKLNG